jgi:RND family efflux transporter MFP subunit
MNTFKPFVMAGLLIVAGCGHREPRHNASTAQDLAAVPVRAQTVETTKLPALEEVVGTVRARLRATLEAKISGRISDMPVMLAQKIKAGDLVARLDAPELKARLEQAEAGLQQAERDWKRASSLFNQQAVTRAEYDAADSRYQVARAALAEARAMIAYVEVLSPFDGVVTRKWLDVGDQAAPGKAVVDLEDPSRLQLEADVPETIAAKIQPNARLAVRLDHDTGELSATVAEIAPIADPVSRTFRVKLDLPNAPSLPPGQSSAPGTPHSLMSGQFARLIVPIGETASLRVPASAVVQRGQMEIVFAVENQRARLHLVKTGRRINHETEILSGLDSGDSVVVDGAALLSDGQPVQTK